MDSQTLDLLSAAAALDDQQAAPLADLTVDDLRNAADALTLPDDQAEPSQPPQSQAPGGSATMNRTIRAAAGR